MKKICGHKKNRSTGPLNLLASYCDLENLIYPKSPISPQKFHKIADPKTPPCVIIQVQTHPSIGPGPTGDS